MSTEAEELLGELVKKIEGLEIKILAISDENKELTRVIQLNDKEYRRIYKKIYEQSYKNFKENKALKEALKRSKGKTHTESKQDETSNHSRG